MLLSGGRNATKLGVMMMPINNAARFVPMMFRAQISNRCQLQRIPNPREEKEPDVLPWAREWTQEIYPALPPSGETIQEREYQISWRMISNSGVDDGIIRPVIGARGWPYYPGSGMKGVFLRACTLAQAERYCGKKTDRNDSDPGILRFHGGYPIDRSWTNGLVDIVHPQQSKQVGTQEDRASAFAMISLYQPTLKFGISSTIDLEITEWNEIWQIWEKALQKGIGGRIVAGYGQVDAATNKKPLYQCNLKGRGQAAKLLDRTGEFRPNIFRAALRGHALRIFGGLTDANSANRLVGELFGSIDRGGAEGLLSLNFATNELTQSTFAANTRWEQACHNVTGEVSWHVTRTLEQEQRLILKKLIITLTHFAMVFGGFGKSWRRADHRLFWEGYYDRNDKPLIGCHWQWADDSDLIRDRSWHLWKLDQIPKRIDKLREIAGEWMRLRQFTPAEPAPWRESWCPERVQVWARTASDRNDSTAIEWLHGDYAYGQAIYESALTGYMGQTGRIWHRMYPVIALVKNPDNLEEIITKRPREQFVEILTIFPDPNIPQCQPFIEYLTEQSQYEGTFEKVWGN
jgi:CRISPR-associated protein Cmr6